MQLGLLLNDSLSLLLLCSSFVLWLRISVLLRKLLNNRIRGGALTVKKKHGFSHASMVVL